MKKYVYREKPWYIEEWYDADIEDALAYLGITINEQSMKIARETLKDIFENKSPRIEMIWAKLEERFTQRLDQQNVAENAYKRTTVHDMRAPIKKSKEPGH